jgi:hypothetical protein
MKRIFCIIIFITINSCNLKHHSDLKGYQTVRIPSSDAAMAIPTSYKPVSIEELENYLQVTSSQSGDSTGIAFPNFKIIKANPTYFNFYFDTANFENMILFQKGEHVNLTKSVSRQFINMLEEGMEQQWKPYNVKRRRMESKYISGDLANIVKVKYLLTFKNVSQYLTQYLVSSPTQTLGIIVRRVDSLDFEPHVTQLKIK